MDQVNEHSDSDSHMYARACVCIFVCARASVCVHANYQKLINEIAFVFATFHPV